MNLAHVHLFLNHVPVLGTLFGGLLLLAAVLMKNNVLQKTGLVTIVVVAIIGLPVYFTGEPAEEVVEHLPGVSEPIIEEHEDAGKIAIVALELLGIVSLAGLVITHHKTESLKSVAGVALALSVVVGVLMFRTAALGGQIRHTEIRNDGLFFTPAQTGVAPQEQTTSHEED